MAKCRYKPDSASLPQLVSSGSVQPVLTDSGTALIARRGCAPFGKAYPVTQSSVS